MNVKELLSKIFRRKNYASPYYGKGNKALFTMPMSPIPMQQPEPKQEKNVIDPVALPPPPKKYEDPDWEQRRYELVSRILCQERRSVILGKLDATPKQLAHNARVLADAAIKELVNNPIKRDDDKGRHNSDE